MNLIEAVKSGKPFKLPRHNSWTEVDQEDNDLLHVLYDEIISEDWVLQETISEKFEGRILELENLIHEMGVALGRAFQSAKKP